MITDLLQPMMVICGAFIGSVEFYVICAVVAAAVLAFAVKPAEHSAVITHLLASELLADEPDSEPRVELSVADDGKVTLIRYGLDQIGPDGAVSIAAGVNGFDVEMEERLVAGRLAPQGRVKARFEIDFFAPERYHVRYTSEPTELMAVMTFSARPGVTVEKPLVR